MVFSFSVGGWAELFCFLSSLEEGVVFVIGARGGQIWLAPLPLQEGSRGMFDMVLMCAARVR